MTKLELAERCQASPMLIDQYIRDGVIAPTWITKDGGRAGKTLDLHPMSAAAVVLMTMLGQAFGGNSPTPKRIVRALHQKIETQWRSPETTDLTVDQELESGETLTVTIRTKFIEKARALVAA
jgi:hypothetical protein